MPYLLRTIEANNAEFNIIVTRRSNSKAIILRFKQSKGELHISAPMRAKKVDIEKFVRAQQENIIGFLQRNISPKIVLNEGDIVPIFGVQHRLVRPQNALQTKVSQPMDFAVRCGGEPFAQSASIQLQRSLQHYASQKIVQIMHAPPFATLSITPAITIRKTRSRYGSCCPKTGRIMLCANLIFAPISVLDSVIFHEAAHLIHANHSADFWALVRQLDANYAASRLWLKNHNAQIFCYEM